MAMYIFTLFFSLLPGLPLPRAQFPKSMRVLVAMTDIDPVRRLNAKEVKETIVNSMAPESLLINPDDAEHGLL